MNSASFVVTNILLLLLIFSMILVFTNGSVMNLNSAKMKPPTDEERKKIDTFLSQSTNEQQQQQQDIAPLIVGGSPAQNGRYPYFCLLEILDSDLRTFYCGCTLIHDNMALSVAQCLVDESFLLAYIRIGNIRYYGSSTFTYDQTAYVDRYWWPTGYSPGAFEYDFLVMRLDRTLNNIPKLRLNPWNTIPKVNEATTAIGIGRTGTNSAFSSTVYEVDLEVQSPSVCRSFFGIYSNDHQLCAHDYGKGACYGDGGGPLIIRGSNPSDDVQVGIFSYLSSLGCSDDEPTIPQGFSRISLWYNTIVDLICNNSTYPSSLYQCSSSPSPPTPSPTPRPSFPQPTAPPPSPSPTLNPVPQPTTPQPAPRTNIEADGCMDNPPGWTDALGRDCVWYSEQKQRCPVYGTDDTLDYLGTNAIEACCVCGGGALSSTSLPPLSWEGWSGCSASKPCGECEGDCVDDSGCLGNLQCFLRNDREEVMGCDGTGIVGSGYCYHPPEDDRSFLIWKGWDGCTVDVPCGKCEGDCDSDEQCSGGLRCIDSNSPTVDGCKGVSVPGGDYCF